VWRRHALPEVQYERSAGFQLSDNDSSRQGRLASLMARHHEKWSEEDDAELRKMAAQGASLLKIAAKLRRTQMAVRSRAARLKVALPKRQWRLTLAERTGRVRH
jgi:hypothetical protein